MDVVLSTAPDAVAARSLVETLVRERHAACGNIVPGITSVFWWEGTVRSEEEVLIVLKTASEQTPFLIERARQIHPYDVPELIALPVHGGDPSYLQWVLTESSGRDRP